MKKQRTRFASQNKLNRQIRVIPDEIHKLTNKPKDMYTLFNVDHLQMSRLANLRSYQQLVQQINQFNEQLIKWKKNCHNIPNILVTYHLYTNLYSRMKYISTLSTKQQDALLYLSESISWFMKEKPKVRNYIPNPQGQMKQLQINPEQQLAQNDLLQTNQIKRQMQPFQIMSRTSYPELFPAKQRLKDYRRKQFAPMIKKSQQIQMMSKTTTTTFGKRYSAYRQSLATRSTFKQTTQSFQTSQKKQSIPQDKMIENLPEVQELKQQDRERRVNQEQVVKQSVVPNNYQQDQAEQDGEIVSDQEQGDQKSRVKKYAVDHYNVYNDIIAQEKIKNAEQSTLRRIINHKQDQIRTKLQELDLRKNMLNWGKVKSNNKKQENTKMQKLLHANKFKDLEYRVKNQYKNNQNNPPTYQMLYRSKSSHTGTLQSNIEKIRIQNAMRTYGKYLNHGNFNQIIVESQEDHQDLKRFRGSSLTSHTQRFQKKKQFGDILKIYSPSVYNNEAEQNMIMTKQSLSAKHITIPTHTIYKSTSIPLKTQLERVTMYTAGRQLPSNPFFPKHLYKTKQKKKKK